MDNMSQDVSNGRKYQDVTGRQWNMKHVVAGLHPQSPRYLSLQP
jgi:hypothetical protein